MTLGTTQPLIDYVENGVTLVHPIPFQFQDLTEIICSRTAGGVRTPLAPGADYTVAGGGGGTGSVTKVSGGVAGTIFRIERNTTRAQPLDLVAHDSFPAADVGLAFDRTEAVNQEQDVELTLALQTAIRVPGAETLLALPTAPNRGSKILQFSADGLSINVTGVTEFVTSIMGALVAALGAAFKGAPGSPGEGYATLDALALGGNAAAILDDAYLAERRKQGKWVFYSVALYAVDFNGRSLTADVAADPQRGLYCPKQADATGAGGAWVRIPATKWVNIDWWGAAPWNAAATNDAAFTAMLTCLRARAYNLGTWSAHDQALDPIEQGPGSYNWSATWEITNGAVIIEGATGGFPGGVGTLNQWPPGVTAIRTQQFNTSGAATLDVVTHIGGDGSIFRRLGIVGGFFTALTEGEYHGFQLRARATIEDCFIKGFQGDGVHIAASSVGADGGDPPRGNANESRIDGLHIESCRDGVNAYNGDTNAIEGVNLEISGCRRWGVNDGSFLGCYWRGAAEACAATPYNTGVTIAASTVSFNGNRYGCIIGQEAWCSTNAPSGTSADNQGWYFLAAAGAASGYPAWFNGMLVRAGGVACTTNPNARSVFDDFYAETGQGKGQFAQATIVEGGMLSEWCYTDKANSGVVLKSNLGVYEAANALKASAGFGVNKGFYAQLGDKTTGVKGMVSHPDDDTVSVWRWQLAGPDIVYNNNNLGTRLAFTVTGVNTAQQFGSGVAQPAAMWMGNLKIGSSIGNARTMTCNPGGFPGGTFGKGAVCIDSNVAAAGKAGFIVTTAGTIGSTAVVKAFGAVDA